MCPAMSSQESGFTLFSIPMGMELLDFLAAQAEHRTPNYGLITVYSLIMYLVITCHEEDESL